MFMFNFFYCKIIWKLKQTFYLISVYFLLIGHVLKRFDSIVAYVNNLSYNLIAYVVNLYYDLIN